MAVEIIECPFCLESLEPITASHTDYTAEIECPRCGRYEAVLIFIEDFPTSYAEKLGPRGNRERANLSAWLREKWDEREAAEKPPLFLDRDFLDKANSQSVGTEYRAYPVPQYFHQRANKLLLALERETKYAGMTLDCSNNVPMWIARAWALNEEELDEFLDYLRAEERIKGIVTETFDGKSFLKQDITILPAGWAHLEKLHQEREQSKLGFIAMWFDDSLDWLSRDALEPAIRDAGYAPLRLKEKEHVNRIDDEIELGIRKSKFVVADFTGNNRNVYFEAGYALGHNIPVIWTCREDEKDKLKFDIQRYNRLTWDKEPEKLNDFKRRLTARIENICGPGPGKRN